MDPREAEKQRVGESAASFVHDGMTVGLGTGSTVHFTILKLAERVRHEGLTIRAVSTSRQTTELATSHGISILDLDDVPSIDLTIDGVDEFDPLLQGIKGGGGALLFEKVVAKASKRNIWVADKTKAVEHLGAFPLPVEILQFGLSHTLKTLDEAELHPVLRLAGGDRLFKTDSGNVIADLHIGSISDAGKLAIWLNGLPGVVENGLFLNVADKVLMADKDDIVEWERPE